MTLNELWFEHVMASVRAKIDRPDIYESIVEEHENMFVTEPFTDDLTEQQRNELIDNFGTGLYRAFGIHHPIDTLLLEYGRRMAYSEEEDIRDYIDELRDGVVRQLANRP
jgi:hypothetical protein